MKLKRGIEIFTTGLKINIIFVIIFSCQISKKNGYYVEKHNNGNIKLEGLYKDGVKDSVWHYYYENGIKMALRNYENGKLNGLSKSWYQNGNIKTISNYKNDKLVGRFQMWYKNGVKNFETFRNEDHLEDSIFTLWYDNGKLKQIGKYVDGKRDSIWIEYNEDGSIYSKEKY